MENVICIKTEERVCIDVENVIFFAHKDLNGLTRGVVVDIRCVMFAIICHSLNLCILYQ